MNGADPDPSPPPSTRLTGKYYLPAEWSPQAATWLAWPHNRETWPENLAEAQSEFAALAHAIADHQQVFVLATGDAQNEARRTLGDISRIELIPIPTNDAWARDYGPTFVLDPNSRSLAAVDWQYNAWGNKYPPYDDDARVANRVAKHLGIDLQPSGLVFEGGGIEVNNQGVMLTTRSCVLNSNRNPYAKPRMIELEFQSLLGVHQVIWLPGDTAGAGKTITGDDTDGHIDQLARFTSNDRIVYAWTEDPDRQTPLRHNRDALLSALQQHSLAADLVPLPLPQPRIFCQREIPGCYCNFLITNEKVIVPQFEDPMDSTAIGILTDLFPQRTVVGLPSLNLSVGLGSFHCLSQQQPSVS